ncbi:oligoribonuclease [Rickettsiella massiliensis]|uniref:oligoribonuclease n=1 Tax=Rickettsiella massiliensis TaxID=676517 RepID=UPI00029A031E|nr:oligoribonuclease [Rickettsiella massiliensis]
MTPKADNLIWIDLEMTGLDTTQDKIIEIATIITNSQLEIIAEGPVFAIFQEESILASMDDWNKKQHKGSGLLERVRASAISEQIAEKETLDFIMTHVPPNKSPMCGNSICQDRRFLARCMPSLERYFHYRNLDVSTLKELAHRWKPRITDGLKRKSRHLALEDVRDSIEELRYYREHFFNLGEP